ncbi:MAG: HAMP domain-containing histidine kinase [Bacteroidales bacterium]|nr:HAMP domain-containing histidine kinase [Candidatus Latescibacterota bacterium]
MEGIKDKNENAGKETVLDARKELEHLRSEIERNKGVFDSARLIVGHELNRPLTSINGYLELIEARFEKISEDKEKRYFSKIKEAVAEMEGLIESFVHMLRFDTPGEYSEDFDEVELHGLVEKFRIKNEGYMVGVENLVPRNLPPILVRRACLDIVLDNLISNGLKHGGGSEPVSVSARIQLDRRGMSERKILIMEIRDNGRGMPPKELDEIFDPFYRGNSRKDVQGLGLGLALVKNIMNIMMGNIHIKSSPDMGTVAIICVPVPEDRPGPYDRIG